VIYVGIDIRGEKGVAATKDGDEKLLENHVYKNSTEGISQLVVKLRSYGVT